MPSTAVLERKKQMVADLSERIKNSCAGVVVDYKCINVEDDTKLRKELREAGVEYTVVKNTILGRAVEDAGLAGLEDVLDLRTKTQYVLNWHMTWVGGESWMIWLVSWAKDLWIVFWKTFLTS